MVILSDPILLLFNVLQDAKYGIKNDNTGKTTRMYFTLELIRQLQLIISIFRLSGKFTRTEFEAGDSYRTGEEHHWEDIKSSF